MPDALAALSAQEPTGGSNNSFLDTDGGGRNATDGGGRPSGSSRSTLVSEAVRRSHAALGAGRGDGPARRPHQQAAQGSTPPVTQHGLADWAPWVREDLARTRLLGLVAFDHAAAPAEARLLCKAGGLSAPLTMAVIRRPLLDQSLLDQARWVRARARLREDRFPEIHVQISQLWPFWESLVDLDPVKAPRTFELLRAALGFASSVAQQMKNDLGVPRASAMAALVMPMIDVPRHGAMPSGHATAAFTLSTLLSKLLAGEPSLVEPLQQLAYRVAFNREVAGVHYPMDSAAGRVLGETLGAFVAAAATGAPQPIGGARFDGDLLDGNAPLGAQLAQDTSALKLGDVPCTQAPSEATSGGAEPVLAQLWQAATEELHAVKRA